MAIRDTATSVFSPRWVLIGIVVGLVIQLLAWITPVGFIGGLLSYVIMGIVVGWASPGNTIVEPGVAAFVIATIGFVLDHLLLAVLGVGLFLAVGYGVLGLVLGMAGGWLGERLQGR